MEGLTLDVRLERLERTVRRQRALLAAAGLVGLFLAVGAGGDPTGRLDVRELRVLGADGAVLITLGARLDRVGGLITIEDRALGMVHHLEGTGLEISGVDPKSHDRAELRVNPGSLAEVGLSSGAGHASLTSSTVRVGMQAHSPLGSVFAQAPSSAKFGTEPRFEAVTRSE